MPTQDEWHAKLEQWLPNQSVYVARNRAITSFYARWYLQEPWLFKWAGMAAFASDQVGVAIALAEMLLAPHGVAIDDAAQARAKNVLDFGLAVYGQAINLAMYIPITLHDAATRQLLLKDLELVKQGNDAIFNDIGWAHLAYATCGLREIEANVQENQKDYFLNGFRMIDEGAQRLSKDEDPRIGMDLISQGNILLLRHEQLNILPTYFDQMSDQGKIIASIGAWLDFEGSAALRGQPWFSGHYGTMAIMTGRKSVTNPSDRWEWIEQDVLPKWSKVNATYSERCAMHRRLVALSNQTPTVLQQTAGLMSFIYPALGLKFGTPGIRALPALG